MLEETLESPLDSKEIKPINPKGNQPWILEGLFLKLNLQNFSQLIWRADSLEKTLMLGKIEGRRRRDDREWDAWMASLTQWTWIWINSGSWWRTGKPGVLQSMGLQRVRHNWVTEQQIHAYTYSHTHIYLDTHTDVVLYIYFLSLYIFKVISLSWYLKSNHKRVFLELACILGTLTHHE